MTGDNVVETVQALVLGAVVITPILLRHRGTQRNADRAAAAAKQTEVKP